MSHASFELWRTRGARCCPSAIVLLLVAAIVTRNSTLIEASFYAVVVFAAARHRGIKHVLAQLTLGQRRFAAGMVLLLIAAQLFDKGRATFPLVSWNMYTRAGGREPIDFYDYTGELQSGRKVSLLDRTSTTCVLWPMHRLNRRLTRLSDPLEKSRVLQELERYVVCIGDRYNGIHSDDPLRAVVADQCVIPLDSPPSVQRTFAWRMELD